MEGNEDSDECIDDDEDDEEFIPNVGLVSLMGKFVSQPFIIPYSLYYKTLSNRRPS